jgi:hypothetical protein
VEADGQLKLTSCQKVIQFIGNDDNTARLSVPCSVLSLYGGKFHLSYVAFMQLVTEAITELQHVTWSAN